MFGVNVTDYDRKVYEEELADFLPDNILDAHVHIYKEGIRYFQYYMILFVECL